MDYCGNCGGNNLTIVGGNSANPIYQCNDCGCHILPQWREKERDYYGDYVERLYRQVIDMSEYEEICIDEEQICVFRAGDKAMIVKPSTLYNNLSGRIVTISEAFIDALGREWICFETEGTPIRWFSFRFEKVGDQLIKLLFLLIWINAILPHHVELQYNPPKEVTVEVMTTAYTIGDGYTPSTVTASGETPYVGSCAYNNVPIGTLLEIDGRLYVVNDRAHEDNVVDIYMDSKEDCLEYGKQIKIIKIIEEG